MFEFPQDRDKRASQGAPASVPFWLLPISGLGLITEWYRRCFYKKNVGRTCEHVAANDFYDDFVVDNMR